MIIRADGVNPAAALSPLNVHDYVAESQAFGQAAAITPTTANLTGGGDPERVPGSRVSPEFFDVLGVRMAMGRGFRADDVEAVMLSDRLWRRRFGARPERARPPHPTA